MNILNRNKVRSIGSETVRKLNKAFIHPKMFREYNKIRPLGPRKSACFAPHSSMFIASNGDIRACCMNIENIYGNIKDSTLSEIWDSPQRHGFMESSDRYELPTGCEVCLNNFTNGNGANSTAILYDQYFKHEKWPKRIDFELSLSCNFDCRMCMFSSHQNNGIKQIAEADFGNKFLSQLDPFLKHITLAGFYGGEPFIIPIYYKIWDSIQKQNPKAFITVQTNGSIINESIIEYLKKGRFQINFSIDSLIKKRFEYIRDKSDFETCMENFHITNEISQKRKIIQSICVCPMKQNIDEMRDLLDFANKHNCLIYFNTVSTKGFTIKEMNPVELEIQIENLINHDIPQKTRLEKVNYSRFKSLILFLKHTLHEIYSDIELNKKNIELNKKNIKITTEKFSNLLLYKLDKVKNKEEFEKIHHLKTRLPDSFFINKIQYDTIQNLKKEEIINFIFNKNFEKLTNDVILFLDLNN